MLLCQALRCYQQYVFSVDSCKSPDYSYDMSYALAFALNRQRQLNVNFY